MVMRVVVFVVHRGPPTPGRPDQKLGSKGVSRKGAKSAKGTLSQDPFWFKTKPAMV
jgi:hypothetical protein